jgi:hypothetical protein
MTFSSSEKALEPGGIRCSNRQIGTGKARPFLRRAQVRLQQMRNCQTGSQHRAMTAIE